ncbi:hybrid sensor histidine kinase/response regulator [Rhodovulum adriaticum]|uniref:Sensory/regulatory protein RpfC n=1 Tax=Rhodovulum adriaticum TaxID=35804 RepID=A0A4R2NYG9_RHOAD|nr:response regulator [Rhodovulum adriaticum]MBK1634180.1 hybrid sensor histidine kinase/response regulator [Rhodovulum adriaticum]TCP27270.1 hypothetical protein EV656_101173 [Rhodovulum adriaticum]
MTLSERLAQERRARLAAERLLDQKSRELSQANARLARHAQSLSDEITQTRKTADDLRNRNTEVLSELAEAEAEARLANRRLWDSLETIRDGFALFDSDDRLIVANRAYLSVFDGLAGVGPGARYADIVHLAAQEGVIDIGHTPVADWVRHMQDRWQTDRIDPLILRLFSGEYIKLVDRRTPSGDMVSLCLDITDMMRMWAAVEAIPDGFVLYDQEDRLVMCNDRYRDFYADSAPALVPGTPFEDILRYGLARGQYPEAEGREEDWLAERMARHNAPDEIQEQRLKDDRWLRILEKRTPDGGLVGLRVDITEQKRQQEALDRARVAAEAANRAKSAFFANMSHELRTPLNGVVGMAELLCDTEMTEEQRLYAQTIRDSGEALLTLLNDVLDFSKIEAERLHLHPEPFDLERTIQEIVLLLQAPARDKALEVLIDYDMFLPTGFTGDRGRIRQVLTNLIGNAVKFTEAGHVLIRVTGLELEGKRQVHITVEDTGIGIDPELQEHIFGEFNQVEDQQNRKFEGTGLGLAITRRLVGLMGGEIWVESERGKGSCFGIRLPLPADDAGDGPAPPPRTGAHSVVVVDDQGINRAILERQLSQIGLRVRCHASPADALADAASADLVVTDHRMPGMDGHALAQALRARGHAGPILMLTSNPAQLREASGDPAPVDMVLQKPVLRRTLYEAIAKLAPADPAPDGTARPMRVLAADDNRTNRLVLDKMLAGLRIDLRHAADGDAALAAFAQARPDLVLMDISMPGRDGKDTTRAIRALERESGQPRVPVVALTAHALDSDVQDILAAGLDGCLTKPLHKAALIETVERHRPPHCLPPVAPNDTAAATRTGGPGA